MAKKFVTGTQLSWDNISNKTPYNESIVFLNDSKKIIAAGNEYNCLAEPITETDIEYSDSVLTLPSSSTIYIEPDDNMISTNISNGLVGVYNDSGDYCRSELTPGGLIFNSNDLNSDYRCTGIFSDATFNINTSNGNIELNADKVLVNGEELKDTKNTVGATCDLQSAILFLTGVKERGASYTQSYVTGYGIAGSAEKRCWLEGNEDSTVLTVPIIIANTIKATNINVDNGITANRLSNTTAIGSSTIPVYINASGIPTACSLPTTVSCTNTTTNSTYYVPFVNGYTTASRSMCTDSGITYNPSTNTLTASTFSGSLSGNATTATTARLNPILNVLMFDLEGAIKAGSSGVNLYIQDTYINGNATTSYTANSWSYSGTGPIQHQMRLELGSLNSGTALIPYVQFVLNDFTRGLDVWHSLTYHAVSPVGNKSAWIYINCPNSNYKVFYKIKRFDNSTTAYTPAIVNPSSDTSITPGSGTVLSPRFLTGLAKSINTTYPQIKRIPLPLYFNSQLSTYQDEYSVNIQSFQVKISYKWQQNGSSVTNMVTVEIIQVI